MIPASKVIRFMQWFFLATFLWIPACVPESPPAIETAEPAIIIPGEMPVSATPPPVPSTPFPTLTPYLTSPPSDPMDAAVVLPPADIKKPIGVAVLRTCTKSHPCETETGPLNFGERLLLYGPEGNQIADLNSPGSGEPLQVLKDRRLDEDTGSITSFVVLYLSYETMSLQAHQDGSFRTIAAVPQYYRLVPAPGEAAAALSEISPPEPGEGYPRASLTAANWEALQESLPLETFESPKSRAFSPLEVRTSAGDVVAIWYTMEPYGFGGDIFYPPYEGLSALDINKGIRLDVLGPEYSPLAISADDRWIAYFEHQGDTIQIRDLSTGTENKLPLLPNMDRGAGYGSFSPGNRYLAWMEARGSIFDDPALETTIRILTMEGGTLSEIPQQMLAELAGLPEIQVKPQGWLNEETLILEVVRVGEWDQPFLVRVNGDGLGLQLLVEGKFIGFLYE